MPQKKNKQTLKSAPSEPQKRFSCYPILKGVYFLSSMDLQLPFQLRVRLARNVDEEKQDLEEPLKKIVQ